MRKQQQIRKNVYFCIRDDDTSFFTTPEELEQVYGEISQWGPISLAVVPFHRAGRSKAIPERFRGRWTIHPLHENQGLVDYLRAGINKGRFEIMLHGYYHDDPSGIAEFAVDNHLTNRVADGRKYLEDLLGTSVRVFVPPHNTLGHAALRAVIEEGLHLGGTAGLRSGWRCLSSTSWQTWFRLRRWHLSGGVGVPWVLDLGDHCEIAGNPITPSSTLARNQQAFDAALKVGGVFCAATHYWELQVPSLQAGEPTVGQHLKFLIDRALSNPSVVWRSVGEIVCEAH